MLKFQLEKGSASGPRAGVLSTSHGEVPTPGFMPVGTAATVKGMAPWDLRGIGAKIVLANTYHLILRPGVDLIKKMGGLHKFMAWNGPILTDSGGYQVVSLGGNVKVDDNGVIFSSHIDGARMELTPENAFGAQHDMGVDIAMCLDEPVKLPADDKKIARAVDRTTEWARRSIEEKKRLSSETALFGIVQGGEDGNLRLKSAREITAMEFDGFAIGGLSVGEDNETMHRVAADTAPLLPEAMPRYLMGVGTPVDLVRAIGYGVDMFDCVLPTRNARNGWIYTREGPLRIKHAKYRDDPRPPMEDCTCETCANFSRAYLRHLYMAGEMLAGMLITRHNLHFYMEIVDSARKAVIENRYDEFAARLLEKMTPAKSMENQEADQ